MGASSDYYGTVPQLGEVGAPSACKLQVNSDADSESDGAAAAAPAAAPADPPPVLILTVSLINTFDYHSIISLSNHQNVVI